MSRHRVVATDPVVFSWTELPWLLPTCRAEVWREFFITRTKVKIFVYSYIRVWPGEMPGL